MKPSSQYVCQSCGAVSPKWAGRCEACGEWNTLVEEAVRKLPKSGGGLSRARAGLIEITGLSGEAPAEERRLSGIEEFDRVCGGGLVPGAGVLIGGDPGIGKSTLLTEVACRLSHDRRVLYISGEEAVDQVRLRARRMGLENAPLELATATDVTDIVATLDHAQAPSAVVIDSIQTMYVPALDSAPGTVAQVRASAQELMRVAKHRDISLLLVGHVTKEGMIAGPRVLEHMVDTVLYFEGERGHHFRILRAVKNRFGPTDEIGVFEMTGAGLKEVRNPSSLFVSERESEAPGTAVFAGIEGTRPLLVEIQALVAPSSLGTPRRAVVGWDSARLSMVLAVLEARCGVAIGFNDIYLNVAGGLRISEPAADLAVAAALVSAFTGTPLPPHSIVFGEIGLTGEIRPVSQAEARCKEAAKLGFTTAFVPLRHQAGLDRHIAKLLELGHVSDLLPFCQEHSGKSVKALRHEHS
jgi:DNA repair protein RadA/Sms